MGGPKMLQVMIISIINNQLLLAFMVIM